MTRIAGLALALVAVIAGVTGLVIGSRGENKTTDAGAEIAGLSGPADNDPTQSIVATAVNSTVEVHKSFGGPVTQKLAHPNEIGAPLTFLVRATEGDWLRVLLPLRPNGATGWIKKSDVRLASHRYKITIELAAHRLLVTDGRETILDTPVGVGTTDTPTPGGLYYTKELMQPPNPNGAYGHYAYGLSGFSNVITSFEGGDGVIGIHGTNDPSSIGKDTSLGCLRISNEAIDFLAKRLPLGVPVEINP
ncbi:MAG: L,D-transpeptidase [Acidimicrobiales bacterium]|nr:L,D-transpeptidase [Acidimicrobiales bacterium]